MTKGLWRAIIAALFGLVLSPAVTAAHVGSPDVIFEGKAGAYDVRVIVRTPMVVPGLAELNVRILHGNVQRVLIRPVYWRTGVAGAPSPDAAKLVPGTRDASYRHAARRASNRFIAMHIKDPRGGFRDERNPWRYRWLPTLFPY